MTIKLPALPDGWTSTRVDRVASVSARIGWKALTADEYQSEGYAFLATPNIKSQNIDFQKVNYITEERYEESPELKLQSGDVLLAKDGNTLGIVNIVTDLPRPATVNGSIAVIRPFGIYPAFLRYFLASGVTQAAIEMLKGGMGVPHLFQWDINRLPISMPAIEEQRRIADFLDAETARIDRLSTLQFEAAKRLDERDAALRDTLVDALFNDVGEISLRRLSTVIEQGASPQCEAVPREPGEWGILKLSAVKGGAFYPRENKRLPDDIEPARANEVRTGDFLVTRANTPNLVGDVAVVNGACEQLLLPDLIYRVGLSTSVLPEFVAQVAMSSRVRTFIQAVARGSSQSMVKLRGEDIRAWPIPAATIAQQRALVENVREGTSTTALLRTIIGRQLALLAERRQALITAAVTGEFDVPSASGREVEK
ncbi:restriction endonuclease subunit S [Nonomuraea sp. NPDC049152]|uniref:restriction endonuclease subunit S n=1 Tax=Nonomuraea sp. NPDC049152 TaxID=3154350 RepID=UPI0033E687FD